MNKTINGKDCSEHRVEVSPYVSATIYIPEEMSASEFRGIMLMSQQLIKVSSSGEKEEEEKINIEWDDKNIEKLKELAKTKTARQISEVFGTGYANIKARCYKLGISPKKVKEDIEEQEMKPVFYSADKELPKIHKSMSNEQRQQIYNAFHRAKDDEKNTVAKIIGCKDKHHVYKLIWQWKQKGMVKYK